jgi:hypothetical protein
MIDIFDIFDFWKKKISEIIVPYDPDYKPNEIIIHDDSEENNDNKMWNNLKPIDLAKIETIDFPDNQYVKEIFSKEQIVLHHTVGSSVDGVITEWEKTPDRVATCIVIDKAGIPWQLFSSKYWGYHLKAGKVSLDKHSIAIEIVNWGQLTPLPNGMFKTYYGTNVAAVTQHYPQGFRGHKYFEKYTNAQIRTIGELILYWNMIYGIPLDYNEDMWDISSRALSGEPGIWTHVSYRPAPAKSDCHPQPELIEMLKALKGIQ